MKKLPTIKEININGITFKGIEISTVISRDIPTVLYKDKYKYYGTTIGVQDKKVCAYL